ncbi:MAG: hypothetical protein CMH60_06465 [Myxococcales bacterium]|nr:hypothetical protein [Myxococcales bacterium]
MHAWSGVGRDLDYSLAAYDRLVGRYPKNSLADDSLIAQAEILQSKRAEYTGARQKLKAVVERYGSGDQVHLAREMLGDLPGAKKVRKPEAKVQSKKFRVILDPGHGGHDAGALGDRKLQEKDVVLAIAQELATLLRSAGIEVLLTRERDTFVSLDQRASFANRHQGDLLISIHANAHENRNVGGVETYYLDVSNRRYKGRLRHAMRNQKKAINDLNYILSDLSTKADTRASLILAQQVQGKLVPALRSAGGKIRDLGTKAAVFQILIDTQMPSVLAEVAFVSNPHEGRFLRSGMGQKRVASALYEAVLAYRKKMASVQQKSLAVLSEKR